MEQQEWRRRRAPAGGRRPAAADDPGLGAGGAGSHTVASAGKVVRKSAAAAPAPVRPPPPVSSTSRWKELRQAVRIKATMATEQRRAADARIADLCAEDREKVAKLIRRIVEIGTLQEETEAEFGRQRGVLEAEIHELREQAKRDAGELEELGDSLKATLLKLRDYQERVLVLEESSEAEARHRLEMDQTVDLLKLEVEKLRQLVRKQKDEMVETEREERARHKLELERVQQQLRDAQEELLNERRDRLQEKQRELDERLRRSMADGASEGKAEIAASLEPLPRCEQEQEARPAVSHLDMSSFLNTSTELPERIKDIMDEWKQRMEDALAGTAHRIAQQEATGALDPESEHAKADANCKEAESENLSDEEQQSGSCHGDVIQRHEVRRRYVNRRQQRSETPRQADRNCFDQYLRANRTDVEESAYDSESDASGRFFNEDDERVDKKIKPRSQEHRNHERRGKERQSSSSRHRQHRHRGREDSKIPSSMSARQDSHRRHAVRSSHKRECRTRQQLQIEYEDSDSGNELIGSASSQSFVLIEDLQGDRRPGSNSGFSDLFESSLFEVVDAIEGRSEARDSRAAVLSGSRNVGGASAGEHQISQRGAEKCSDDYGLEMDATPSTANTSTTAARLQSLLREMQARERKLARLDAGSSHMREEGERAANTSDDPAEGGGEADNLGDADFELFDQVRDIYASEVFSARLEEQHQQQ